MADMTPSAVPDSNARVLGVAAGHAQFCTLTTNERTRAHNLIDERLSQRVARLRFKH